MVRQSLGSDRHLLLGLHDTGIGLARATGILEFTLEHDASAKALGRAAIRVCQQRVLGMRSVQQHPARPFLPYQILSERVSKHGTRWGDVDHVRATILLAQRIIRRLDVEQRDLLVLACVSEFQ